MNNTTRKYPRTLEEAFGPYTSRDFKPAPRKWDRDDVIILWGCTVLGTFFLSLVFFGIIS